MNNLIKEVKCSKCGNNLQLITASAIGNSMLENQIEIYEVRYCDKCEQSFYYKNMGTCIATGQPVLVK